jgi:HK97 family phage portal protein
VFASLFSDGNAFGIVTGVDSNMRPTQIELVAPEQVTEGTVVDGIPQAKVNNKVERLFPWGDLWHMAGEMVLPGSPFGLSPVQYGDKTTGTSLAAEAFGGAFFTKGGHPTGLLSVPGAPTQEQADAIKARLMSILAGSREPLVVPDGTNYVKLQVSPEDSQYIDLMRFEVEQTCRRHGVPPSMVYGAVSGQSVTYSNATQADLAYLKHTLSYPIDLFEDAMSAMTASPRVVKLNRDAILEGDPMGRLDMHVKRVQNRLATINEVRALEDLDPFGPEFDEPGIPAATVPAEAADLPSAASDDA